MTKWIPMLSGLLIAQLALAVAVHLSGEDHGAFQANENLIAIDKANVDALRIEDGKNSVVLKKNDGQWLLPQSGDFPANDGNVERLLDKLTTLKKGWPVATTSGAARRFKVSEDEFERKLTLMSKEQIVAELYVGTSPGFRKVHLRPAGEDAVFSVAFNSWEANAEADDWIDKGILILDESHIVSVEMPDFVLKREEGALKLAGLADGEETNEEEARAFIARLAGLRIQSLLGSDASLESLEFEDGPDVQVELERQSGEPLTYQFFKPEEESYYVLKRSDLDRYFTVAEFTVDPIKETTREKLVRAEEESTSEAAAAGNNVEAPTKEAE